MSDKLAARVAKLKEMRRLILERLKPGDRFHRGQRIDGQDDVFLGLFEHSGYMFKQYGWYAKFEFTEARGRRSVSRVEMTTLLKALGIEIPGEQEPF